MQADNGSYVYLMPGFQTGYSSYYPLNTNGVDGQYVGHHVYPPGSIFQQPVGSPGYYSAPLPYGELMPSPYLWDSSLTTQDASHGIVYNEVAAKPSGKPTLSSQSHTGGLASKSLANPKLHNSLKVKSSPQLLDVSSGHIKRSPLKSVTEVTICSVPMVLDILL